MLINFVLHITHKSLLFLNKDSSSTIEEKTLNVLSIIIYLVTFATLSLLYSVCLITNIISYNKITIFTGALGLFGLIRYIIFKYYKDRYNSIIAKYSNRFCYSKGILISIFFSFWIGAFLILWTSILIIRNFIF